MLHLSELYRVTGLDDRSAELVHDAADLLGRPRLSPEDIDALAPVSCHALFCLGALAYWEGRLDEAGRCSRSLVARRRLRSRTCGRW